jgi:hypothetical protein
VSDINQSKDVIVKKIQNGPNHFHMDFLDPRYRGARDHEQRGRQEQVDQKDFDDSADLRSDISQCIICSADPLLERFAY